MFISYINIVVVFPNCTSTSNLPIFKIIQTLAEFSNFKVTADYDKSYKAYNFISHVTVYCKTTTYKCM